MCICMYVCFRSDQSYTFQHPNIVTVHEKLCTYKHTCTHNDMNKYMQINICIILEKKTEIDKYMRTCIHAYIRTNKPTNKRTDAGTYERTYERTYKHTYKHT